MGSEYRVLNTNGPLHVGGVSFGPKEFQKMARAQFKVKEKEMPHARGLVGCVKNLTLTEGVGAEAKMFLYDLGNPADGENYSGRVVSTVLTYNKLSFTSSFIKSVKLLKLCSVFSIKSNELLSSLTQLFSDHCGKIIAAPVAMPFNMNFLIAIVCSLAILVIVIATLAIYKKRKPVYR